MAESEEDLKSLLMRVKEESEKAGLKLNMKEMKIMASSPITAWQIEGEKVEAMADFTFLGSKITLMVTAAIKLKNKTKHLFLERKAMTSKEHNKNQRYHFADKGPVVKAVVFP